MSFKPFVTLADASIDVDSPLTEAITQGLRDNAQFWNDYFTRVPIEYPVPPGVRRTNQFEFDKNFDTGDFAIMTTNDTWEEKARRKIIIPNLDQLTKISFNFYAAKLPGIVESYPTSVKITINGIDVGTVSNITSTALTYYSLSTPYTLTSSEKGSASDWYKDNEIVVYVKSTYPVYHLLYDTFFTGFRILVGNF